MKPLSDFICPVPELVPPMRVKVINDKGIVSKTFETPQGFQLERYVDSLYPNNELMIYELTNKDDKRELNVTVLGNFGYDAIEIYVGTSI